MSRAGKEHFIGLEWLRFLLGLYIVVFHTLHNYPEQKLPIVKHLTSVGFYATSSFFILSGFLLAHVYCRRGELREPAVSFWAKRFANLYPLHIVSILLTIAVLAIISSLGIPPDDAKATLRFVVYDSNEDFGDGPRTDLHHWMSNGELAFNSLLQLFMLQAWNPYYLTFNPPLWSISTLFFFYLSFPLFAPKLMRLKHKGRWLAIIMAIYLVPPLLVIYHGDYGMPFTGILHRMPIIRLPEFLAGIVLYGLFRDNRDAGREPGVAGRWGLAALALVGFVGAAWLAQGAKFWYFLLHNGLLLPAEMALIYLCALAATPSSEKVLHWSRRLGAASLPLFVLHVPAFTLFSRSEKILGVASTECFENWFNCAPLAGEQPLSIAFYPLFLLLTVILCVWVQERAVVPTRRWLLRYPLARAVSPPS